MGDSLNNVFDQAEFHIKDTTIHDSYRENAELVNADAKLFEKAKQGDSVALSKIVSSNLRLVHSIAKRYYGLGLEVDDLIQEGTIGLMTAIMKYDLAKGCKFSTYAIWWIKQAVIRAIQNDGHTIRLPVYVGDLLYKYKVLQREITVTENREPTVDEIAEKLGVPLDQLLNILNKETTVSLDTPILSPDNDEDCCLGDFIEDSSIDVVEEIENTDMSERLHNLLDSLNEREREIICLRFGLYDNEPKTLQEISAYYGLTRERIRQIEVRALRKLKVKGRNLMKG